MKRNTLILLAILCLAAVLRLVWLNNIPNSITNDQLYYILNAKSFLLTGKDLSGSITPLQLFGFSYPQNASIQAELPFFLQFPFSGLFATTLFVAALPNVILSVATVAIMYLIAKKLFDMRTALITTGLAASNPWFIFTGRSFYEVVPAVFLYLAGFYILLIAKKWKVLLSFPLFLLAFYSYIGTKLIFLPFVMISVGYVYFFIQKKKYAKQYVVLLLLCFMTVIIFFLRMKMQPESSRLGEVFLPNNQLISEQVNYLRKTSIQNPLLPIFENKYTVFIKSVADTFFNIFSPSYLFLHGDTFFSIYRHGLFYIIDAVFLLVGSLFLFAKKRVLFLFFITMIILSTLPQISHYSKTGGNFTPHIALLFPFFLLLIGYGIYEVIELGKGKGKVGLILGILLLYAVSLLNFSQIYFYQFPLQTGVLDFSSRVVANYVSLAKETSSQVYVFTPLPDDTFRKYVFYNTLYSKNTASAINASLQAKNYSLENVHFLPCNQPTKVTEKDTLMEAEKCGKLKTPDVVTVAQLADSGGSLHITYDKVCRAYSLKPYIAGITVDDLNVESLPEKAFCEAFIIH